MGSEIVADILGEAWPVSRETRDRLEVYVVLLKHWQKRQNLVSAKTLDEVWRRHVADSAQVLAYTGAARHFVDFGSGAGFPGLVIALLLPEGGTVRLIEANGKKAAFLRAVIRETGVPAEVINMRIEAAVAGLADPVDVVTARALAPLALLVGHAAPLISRGAIAVFHKGRDFQSELEECAQSWSLDLVKHQSRTDPEGSIVIIKSIQPVLPRSRP